MWFSGVITAKLCNFYEINSPRIILCNWWLLRQQTLPCWVTRNLRSSLENISRRHFLRNWLRRIVAMAPKIIPPEFFCVSNFFAGGGFEFPTTFWRTCIRIEFKLTYYDIFRVCVFISVTRSHPAKSVRYVYQIQDRWCSELVTYVYVYWMRNSGPKTRECACIFSCWDGTCALACKHTQHKRREMEM